MSFTAGTICNLKGTSSLLEMTCRLEFGVSKVAAIWRVGVSERRGAAHRSTEAPLKYVAEY